MAKLTNKQEAFCIEYMKDSNGTQAAIRAGYSKNSARQIAEENLSKPDIAARIKDLQVNHNAEAIFSREKRIEALAKIAEFNMNIAGDDDTNAKMINPTAAISAIDQINKMTGDHAAIKQKLDADIEGSLNVPTNINLIAKK